MTCGMGDRLYGFLERRHTSYNKNASGSAHCVRSVLRGLKRAGVVSCQLNSVGLSKAARFRWGHVGNI